MKNSFRILSQGLLLFILLSSCRNKTEIQQAGPLPRSVPEAEGVSSEMIIQFLDSAALTKHEFHSIMILRHGKVIAEGWWSPYRSDLKHTLYSTSKSFTSTAVGFAVTEKLISLNDTVISFFPGYLPDTVSDNLASLTIRDLITMSVGQDPDPTFSIRASDTNWVKSFLAIPVINKPGSKFLYNSMATYMLSAIIQKVTGEKVIDYLTPRLFEPLGIKDMDWEEDPMGINTGGWGLRVKTEDMAKLGLLYLQKGMWNGRQIIPSAWVEEATTFKIDQAPEASQSKKDSSDWMQGYCYQFWRSRNNSFRADGAFGQYILVLPEKDAVIAITAESPDMQDEINLVWKYLLPAFKEEALPADTALAATLKSRLASLSLPVSPKAPDSPVAAIISGKTFMLESNDQQLDSVSFEFNGELCRMKLSSAGNVYSLDFGSGKWTEGETGKAGPRLIATGVGLPARKVVGCYFWKDENTIELTLRYIESPHHETFSCKILKDKIVMNIAPSIAFGSKQKDIKGTLKKE
jgi:CubicO group peptidase (beta-lactamase class C family)